MSKSFAHFCRAQLDAALSQKHPLLWPLLPILFLISWIVSLVAQRRRTRSYSAENTVPFIVCVGNVSLGGSGKSPVVQRLARDYLLRGHIVGIASRGITQTTQPVHLCSLEKENSDFDQKLSALSDENREHYELLKDTSPVPFFILQNRNRVEALQTFTKQLSNHTAKHRAVLILDDGLQHFQCPRDVNISLWQPPLLKTSPPFSMPIGPYREGFGRTSLKKLLSEFNYRIWSRARPMHLSSFVKESLHALNQYDIPSFSQKDVFTTYQVKIKKWTHQEGLVEHSGPITDTQMGVLAGIAYPEAFLKDLQTITPEGARFETLFLTDHAPFHEKLCLFMAKHETLVFTLKDFCRWSSHSEFQACIRNKIIYCCFVDVSFWDHHQTPLDFAGALLKCSD